MIIPKHCMDRIRKFFFFQSGLWKADKIVDIPSKKVEGWALPDMPCM